MNATCTQWDNGRECGSTNQVRPYLQGPRCAADAPPPPPTQAGLLCPACGYLLDPAAAAGPDGTSSVFDRHPGCEPGGTQLRLVKGGMR